MNGIFCAAWHNLRRECIGGSGIKHALNGIKVEISTQNPYHYLRYASTIRPTFPCHNATRAFHASATIYNPRFHEPGQSPLPSSAATSPTEGVRINLSQRASQPIFKGSLSREHANDLLSKLQRQREMGTLDNKIEDYSQKAAQSGLAYLRSRYPMDEDAAIVARIDNELDHEFRLPQTDTQYSQSEKSGLKEIHQIAEKKEKREEARQKKLELKAQKAQGHLQLGEGTISQVTGAKQGNAVVEKPRSFRDLMDPDRKPKQPPGWIKKIREDATDKEVPNLTTRQRLLPGGLFTLSVVLLSLWFADTYIPPSREARLFPDVPPAAACVQTIVVANVAVLLLWKVPQMWKFLNKYFMALPLKPRPAQLFFATISHQSAAHCLTNMAALWLIGVRLHDDIGRGPFLALIVSGGVISTYVTLVIHTYKHLFFTATLGASGTIAALIATSCVLHEGLNIKLPFFPGLDTSWLNTGVILAVIMFFEAISLRKGVVNPKVFEKKGITIDHIGHISGYATGIAAGMYVRKHDPRWRNIERRSFWNKGRWQKAKDGEVKDGAVGKTAVDILK